MAQKKLEKGSVWEKADANGDGIVSDQEMAMRERMVLLENRDKKEGTLFLTGPGTNAQRHTFHTARSAFVGRPVRVARYLGPLLHPTHVMHTEAAARIAAMKFAFASLAEFWGSDVTIHLRRHAAGARSSARDRSVVATVR